MILHYWQIAQATEQAKKEHGKTIVGSRINYQFCHDLEDKPNGGICGLFGWIYEHHNPGAPSTEPMDVTLALETSIDEFYVTERAQVLFSRGQLAGDYTSVNKADQCKEIDDTLYGPEED